MAAPMTREYETLYGVSLLDDLHNYFPAVLYEPEQFRNVGQLLMYIQRQTHRRFDLFTFGQTAYNERRPQPIAQPTPPPAPRNIATLRNMPPLIPATPPVPPTNTLSTPVISVNLGTAADNQSIPNPTTVGAGSGDIPFHQPNTRRAETVFQTMGRPATLHSFIHQLTSYTNSGDEGDEEEENEDEENFEQIHEMVTGHRNRPIGQTLSATNTIQLLSALLQLPTTPLVNTNSFPAGFLNPVVVRPTEEQITTATTVRTLETASSENCAICQDSIAAQSEQREINHCHHAFHRGCIDTWFEQNVHCPVCRHDIRENSSSQEN